MRNEAVYHFARKLIYKPPFKVEDKNVPKHSLLYKQFLSVSLQSSLKSFLTYTVLEIGHFRVVLNLIIMKARLSAKFL